MKKLLLFAALACIFGASPFAFTKGKKQKMFVPLSKKILTAMTVAFIDKTGRPRYADMEYRGLLRWGRFRIVDKSEKPDLIFLFSASEGTTEYCEGVLVRV